MFKKYISAWSVKAICLECGWFIHCPFSSYFHIHQECCSRCGREIPKSDYWMMADKKDYWAIMPMRRWHKKEFIGIRKFLWIFKHKGYKIIYGWDIRDYDDSVVNFDEWFIQYKKKCNDGNC